MATASLASLGLATLLAQDADASTTAPATCPALKGLATSSATSCAVGLTAPGDRGEPQFTIRPDAAGPTPYSTIGPTSGPLNNIYIGDDFGCQAEQDLPFGEQNWFFYPGGSGGTAPGDCGTFLSFDDDLYGPDFSAHDTTDGGTAVGAAFGASATNYTAWDSSQSPDQSDVTGSGTQADPYEVTTDAPAGGSGVEMVEADTYVVGNEYYRSDVTIENTTAAPIAAILYHAADCAVADYGIQDASSGGVGCAENSGNSPPGQIEELFPVTGGSHYVEEYHGNVWDDIAGKTDLPDMYDKGQSDGDPAVGLSWDVTVPAGRRATVSFLTNLSSTGQLAELPAVTTGATSGISQTAATVAASVTPKGLPVSSCVFQFGKSASYGSSVSCNPSPGSGDTAVPVSAALSGLSPGTTYHYRTSATNSYGTVLGAGRTFTTSPLPPPPPPAPRAPSVVSTSPPGVSTSGAALSGTVVPEGLLTSAHFEVGLDPKYLGGGAVQYTQSTGSQTVGSDFSSHAVSGSVSGLLPNALYHARLVASNADGTVDGTDVTFTTAKQAAPGAPTLGQTANLYPISGLIFVKPPKGKTIHGVRATTATAAIPKGQGFIPLTQARQVPIGSQIDALRGTLQLKLATAKKRKTQAATVNGSVFSLAQNRRGRLKGLTTFTLKENAFKGAPSYTSCTSKKTTLIPLSPLAQIARLSSKILQTLHASDHGGKFRTRGRYSASTVRGTDWFTEDRCDGTLTKVRRGSVNVQDFRTRKTIILRAGHSFLAKRF